MNSKVFYLLIIASYGVLAFDSSEEFDSRCDSTCPDDDAARSCCQEMGFATGYCKPFGRAECEGRRSYERIQNGRGYGRQMPRDNYGGNDRQIPRDNYSQVNDGSRTLNEKSFNQVDGQENSSPNATYVQNPTSSRSRRSILRFWNCDPICENGGSVCGCCRNYGYRRGGCNEGKAYCSSS